MRLYFERDLAFEENTDTAEVLKNNGNEDPVYLHFQLDISQIYSRDRMSLCSPGYGITRI